MRAQHQLEKLFGEGSSLARDLSCVITLVVNHWLGGICPLSLEECVASAPLTSLSKLDGGIHPVAVGTIWRRLISKVAMKEFCENMTKYLNDFQFDVGVSSGAKTILHSANKELNH